RPRRRASGWRAGRPHRRHRHAPAPGRPPPDGVDGEGRGGSARRGWDHGEPEHRPVRRASADGRLGHPDGDACLHDAGLRRGRLPRGRTDRRRRARAGTGRGRADGEDAHVVRAPPALSGVPRVRHLRELSEPRLTVVTHPLVQHKLSYLRDKDTPTVHFRKLANELTLLLTYEATKDFPTEDVAIETPLEQMTAQRIAGKKVAVCPV